MTTRAVASLLRKAWLLAGTLALIAGLLGMHVLTSSPASHGAMPMGAMSYGAVPQVAMAFGEAAGHTAVAQPAAGLSSDATGHASVICGSSCPGMLEAGSPCVPSAPGSPVTGIRQQATAAALTLPPAVSSPGPACDYLPPSPTPCDLSISRT